MSGGYLLTQNNKTKININAALKHIASCFFFAMVLIIASLINESNQKCHIPFQIILFTICTWPIFLGSSNNKHRLLLIFMACYYIIFGLSNFFDIIFGLNQKLLLGPTQFLKSPNVNMPKSDWVIIIGAVSFVLGYYISCKLFGGRQTKIFSKDWDSGVLLIFGTILWIVGFIIIAAYDMVVTPMHIPEYILGMPLGIASNMKYFCRLGILMIIYIAIKGYRQKLTWALLATIIIVQFIFGFIADSKETSYFAPALLTLGIFYIKGSLNKKIIAISLISFMPYLIYFNIYRGHILQSENMTRLKAFNTFDKNASKVISVVSKEKVSSFQSLDKLRQRIDGKVYVDIIVNGTDSGRVRFLSGETLMYLFYAAIPRMFWHEKPDMSTGQMFNKAFSLSQSSFTFVPTTQLGELYWNFGTLGVIAGMTCIGIVFGVLSSMFLVSKDMTVVRFMLLMLASYFLAVRFEANIGLQYPTFFKLLIVLSIFDFIIGRLGLHRRIEQTVGSA
jgi:hypothetical protein